MCIKHSFACKVKVRVGYTCTHSSSCVSFSPCTTVLARAHEHIPVVPNQDQSQGIHTPVASGYATLLKALRASSVKAKFSCKTFGVDDTFKGASADTGVSVNDRAVRRPKPNNSCMAIFRIHDELDSVDSGRHVVQYDFPDTSTLGRTGLSLFRQGLYVWLSSMERGAAT
jgi:hypothetical protein